MAKPNLPALPKKKKEQNQNLSLPAQKQQTANSTESFYQKNLNEWLNGSSQTAKTRYPAFEYKAQTAPQDLASYLTGSQMYRPERGKVLDFDYDAARQARIDNQVITDNLVKLGYFNTADNLYGDKAHLTTQEFRDSEKTRVMNQLGLSKQEDAKYQAQLDAYTDPNANGLRNWLAVRQSEGMDVANPTDEDLLAFDRLVNGNELRKFDYGSAEGVAYQNKVLDQWRNTDFDALTSEQPQKPDEYKSMTGTYQAQLDAIEAENNRVARVAELAQSATASPTFAQMSVYNDTASDGSTGNAFVDFWNAPRYAAVGKYEDKGYFINNAIPYASQALATDHSMAVQAYLNAGLNMLTPEEKAIYNYYINSGDEESANEYLDILSPQLLQRRADVMNAQTEVLSENPWTAAPMFALAGLARAGSGIISPVVAAATATGLVENDPNAAWNDWQQFNRTVGTTQKGILAELGGPEIFGQNLYNLAYDGLNGLLDLGIAVGAGTALGNGVNAAKTITGLMQGSQAFSGAMYQAAERGLSGMEGVMQGMLAATIEGLTEKFSLDALFDNPVGGLKYVLRNSAIEASEEVVSAALDPVADGFMAYVFDHKTQLQEERDALLAMNVPMAEADAIVMNNLMEEIISSGLIGGFVGGTFSTGYASAQSRANRSTGQNIQQNAGLNQVVDIGLGMGEGSKSNSLAKALKADLDANKRVNLGKVGRLANALESELGNAYTDAISSVADEAIVDRMVELGDEKQDARAVVGAIKKVAFGTGELTSEERSALAGTKSATKVVAELAGEDSDAEWIDKASDKTAEAVRPVKKKQKQLREAVYGVEPSSDVKAAAKEAARLTGGKEGPKSTWTKTSIAFDDDAGKNTGDVVRFEENKHGTLDIVVKTSEGEKTISHDQITSADGSGVAKVLAYANQNKTRMSAEEANELLATYETVGGNAEAFIDEYRGAFDAGYYGGAKPTARMLGEGFVARAYEAGMETQKKADAARFQRALKGGGAGAGAVTFLGQVESNEQVTGVGSEQALKEATKSMTASQRSAVEGVKAVARASGVNVVLFDSTQKGRSAGVQNGSFNARTNTIYIDINAGVSTQKGMQAARDAGTLGYAMLRTMSHELTHYIEANSADGYAALKRQAKLEFELKGKNWADLVNAKIKSSAAAGERLTRYGAEAEVIADACEMMLQDTTAIERMAKQDPSLKDKIVGFIRSFLDKVRKALNSIGAGSQEAKALMEMRDGLMRYTNELQKLWDDAFVEAAGNASVEQQVVELSDVNTQFSIRQEDPPKKTGIAYKVFFEKNGKLYPPMVANPGGTDTPVGVWLNADVGTAAPPSKTGRLQVKAGGKGTQGGSGSLAFRPGWHLGDIPKATQFNRLNKATGIKELFPYNFVWAECEYAMDVDYQEEAMSYGYNANGKFQHSLAGLPKLPVDGYYHYRTNPDPNTVPWVITGAMKVNKILSRAEVDAILRENGVEPTKWQGPDGEQMEADDDTRQFSVRDADVSYNALINKPDMPLVKLTSNITTRDRKAITNAGYNNAMSVGRPGKSGMPAVTVKDIGRAVHVSKRSLEHGLDRRADLLSAATQHVGELLQNAILINTANAKLPTASSSYILLSAGENQDGTITPVSFVVNRFTDQVESFDVLKSMKNKKNQPRITAGIGANALLPTDSTISIAELISLVKDDFTDVWSNDVMTVLGLTRSPTEITKDLQHSLRSAEFQRWFGDSVVVNEDGSPKVMYHGTPYGDFTVFKGWQYFTDDKNYADRYHNPGASSIRGRYPEATNKKTYAVYLSVKKPFDTRLPEAREIWKNEFFGNYSRTPLSEKGLPDWTDGIDLVDFIEENEYDFDGIILDEGATGGYGDEVQSRGVSIVVRKPSQIKSATDNVGTYDSNNPDIRYSQRSSASDIYEQYREVYTRLLDARKKYAEAKKAMEASGELDAVYDLMKNDMEAGAKAYKELLDKYGVTGLNINELQEEANNLYRQWDEARTAELEEEERKQLEKSGKSIEDYHRDKAVKEFGYTPYFYDGGYIVPNGKMLNFSGEKGRHYGSRGQDHRAIGTIYVNKENTEAMVAFMHEGNIRLMPESPGLDIATSTEPTTQQYATIRRFVREYMDDEYLNVDFTDENGSVVGNLEYEGKIYADRVVNDIKHYYATGEIRDQGVSRYQYSQRKADDATVRDFLRDMKPTTTMNETERILLKRYQSALEEVAQKETAIAEQENIIATGAEGDELIKAKNRLGLLRKQAERANKNLLAAEQHDGFARIMATSQETISKYLGTTDNVADATDRLEAEIKGLEDSLGSIRDALTKAAEGQKAAFARGLFDRKQLKAAAETLKVNYGSKMSVENIADRLALVYSEMYAGGDDKAARFSKAARSLAIDLVRKNKFSYKSDVLPMLRDNVGTISLGETDLAEIKNAGLTLAEYKRTLAPYVRISSSGNDLSSHVSNAAYYGDGYLASILGDGYEGDFAMRLYEVVKSEKAKEASAGYDGKTEDEVVFEAMVDIAGASLPIEVGTAATEKLRNEFLKFAGDTEAAAAKVDTAIKKAKAASAGASSVWREAVKNETLTQKVVDYYRALEEQRRLLELKEQKQMLTEQLNSDATKKLLETREHYQEMFQRDRTRREINAEAAKKASHIKAVVKRLDDRIRHETDYHNVKEDMKPAVRKLVETFLDGFGNLVFDQSKADRLLSVYQQLDSLDSEESAFYSDDVKAMLTDLANLAAEDAERRASGGSLLDNAETKLAIYSQVSDIADNIWHMVQMADEVFIEGKRASFGRLSENTGKDMLAQKDYRNLYGKLGKAQQFAEDLIRRGNMIPTYFFESLKNSGMQKLFDNVMNGQTKYAKVILDGQQKMQEAKRKYNYAAWAGNKPVEYETAQKHKIQLTTEQMMWVYATAKRERSNELAATSHLAQGGFKYEGEVKKGKIWAETDKPHRLNDADVNNITNMLTSEQKAYADELVEYLSTDMAEVGNEASMEMFGIRKYQEQYYFPFKTASEQRYQRSDAGSTSTTNDSRVKHSSFTHRLTRHANTTLVMGDFSDIIADHINQMATYASFMNPIESMNRVLNYKIEEEDGTQSTIRSLVGRKYGDAALRYVQDFMKDINGGVQTDSRGMGAINTLIGAFKRGAVAASLSVAVQQPTAYVRAFAYMNPKYFFHGTGVGVKEAWAEAMQYSGTAVVKDMGKFDVGLGQTAKDWISEEDEGEFSLWERAKRYIPKVTEWKTVKTHWGNMMTALPGFMDQLTWSHIWKAVKAEQAELHPGMDVNSEAFLQMCGKRFDYIINHTQVYDSVLSKSNLMRSKNALNKMATSFMSEPTLTANLMYSAFKGDHTGAERSKMIATAIASNILAAAFAAAISAWNKDDDERTAPEKYLSKFAELAVDNLNPLGMLPYLSDISSMLDGYDVERVDMSVVKDVFEYSQDFFKTIFEDKTVPEWRQWENFTGTLLNLIGLPAKNISRDVRRIRNLVQTKFETPSPSTIGYSVLESAVPYGWYSSTKKAYYERYVNAVLNSDNQKAYNIKDFMVTSKGTSSNAWTEGVRAVVKNLVAEGKMTATQATEFLRKHAPYKNDKDNIKKPKEWAGQK